MPATSYNPSTRKSDFDAALEAVSVCHQLDRPAVRAAAGVQFDAQRIVARIVAALKSV
jgi:hypothetical protein